MVVGEIILTPILKEMQEKLIQRNIENENLSKTINKR